MIIHVKTAFFLLVRVGCGVFKALGLVASSSSDERFSGLH